MQVEQVCSIAVKHLANHVPLVWALTLTQEQVQVWTCVWKPQMPGRHCIGCSFYSIKARGKTQSESKHFIPFLGAAQPTRQHVCMHTKQVFYRYVLNQPHTRGAGVDEGPGKVREGCKGEVGSKRGVAVNM